MAEKLQLNGICRDRHWRHPRAGHRQRGCRVAGGDEARKRYRSIGILGARTGAGPHIMAADEAVKATNTEVVSIELPRDTKGGAGHGSLIVLGGNDVSDVKRGIEVALKELDRTFGDVYGNEAGHIELQYTARASYALEKRSAPHWAAPAALSSAPRRPLAC